MFLGAERVFLYGGPHSAAGFELADCRDESPHVVPLQHPQPGLKLHPQPLAHTVFAIGFPSLPEHAGEQSGGIGGGR